MVKQTKLGFDKTTAQERLTDKPLVDVRGNFLRDQNGDFLFTEEKETPSAFFKPQNSTSTVVNNAATPDLEPFTGSIPVKEVFPEVSEVSSSLLGIPRLGKQQSLLSDVSVYGQDPDTWEFTAVNGISQPEEWSSRLNQKYGSRFFTRLTEYADQQALAIEGFPPPFSFPYGPKFSTQNLYNPSRFTQYLRFVELGNILYDYFVENNQKAYAEKNFLPSNFVKVNGTIFINNTAGADVIYNNDNTKSTFKYIENWTVAWMDIRDGKLRNPITNSIITPNIVNLLLETKNYQFSDTFPGYASNIEYYAQLQSKESFRYQPGAISGFTFGVKSNSDPASNATVLEWGCANETDQLMFQVRGSQFNIVRRSTVPLSESSLQLMNLSVNDQIVTSSPNPFERENSPLNIEGETLSVQPLYETIIRNDFFNGDPVNGTGRSGYNISFNEVTMYKIEFSWYGAIGAKFYVYVPVENDEARWVLLHTLLIENQLDSPSLQNPFMHFRYSMSIKDTSSLKEPLYLYKYGASCYIDGDDQGSFTFNNYTSKTNKAITSTNSRPIIGIYPKETISNSDGIETKSQKNFYIDRISVNSDVNARIDILECEGCKGGYGQFYATGLKSGQRGIEDRFRINTLGELQYVNPNKRFSFSDSNKKIIADGIFCSYIFNKPEDETNTAIDVMNVKRRIGITNVNTPISDVTYTSSDISTVNGVPRSLINLEFDARLTGYDEIVGSDTPITKDNFTVHFLNPNATESLGQYSEFIIGVTDKKPELVFEGASQVLKFNGSSLNIGNELYGEWVSEKPNKSIDGIENREIDERYGGIMGQDPRLPQPNGSNSGNCSSLNFSIQDLEFSNVEYRTSIAINSTTTLTGNFIVFSSNPNIILEGGEIGIFNGISFESSGVGFLQNQVTEFTNEFLEIKYYAEISSSIDLSESLKNDVPTIAFKTIRCFGRYIDKQKAYTYNTNTFYIWVAMRDNAQINNIVVEEYTLNDKNAFTPNWLIESGSTVSLINTALFQDSFDGQGKFIMGGITTSTGVPANFTEKNRLDSVKIDTNLVLPLRPANLKSSIFVGAGKTEVIDADYLFDIDKFKVTKGTFNNKTLYLSAVVTDQETLGKINININGKEQ